MIAAALPPTQDGRAADSSAGLAADATSLAPDGRPTPPPPLILKLQAISGGDRARVGNKAWRLAHLARAGLPVPAAFCIAADSFAASGAATQGRPPADELSAELLNAISVAYRQLGSPQVAVRSSAADEDLAEQSGAGHYTTVLNVRGEAALLAAVRSCRAGRRSRQKDQPAAPLAVLVQIQIKAEAAGVLFTADPLTGRSDRLVVNVTPGLGEPLAAGRVGGDTFHLSPTGELLQQKIRRKETMLTCDGEQPVPPGRRQRPTLTTPELRRLAHLAAQVEACFGEAAADRDTPARPGIDIEFAVVMGQPVLLQARPIPSRLLDSGADASTAALRNFIESEQQKLNGHAAELRASGRVGGREIVWSAGNIRELLPTPSRFSFALFRHIFAGRQGAIAQGRRRLGYRLGGDAGEDLFVLICGQPYFNLEIDAATYHTGLALPVEDILGAVEAQPERANYPELGLYPDSLAATPGGSEAAAAFRRQMLGHASRQRRRFAALLGWLSRQHDAASPIDRQADTATLQAAIADELRQLRQLGMRFVIAARFGFCFADLLRRRLLQLSANPAAGQRRYARLLQGLAGSRITEQSIDLERLSSGQLTHPAFLARYGHLAANELELTLPRLAEQGGQVEAMLAELQAGGRSPQAEFARQRAQRQRCEKALRRYLAGQPETAAELFADLDAAQHYLPLRESLKYHLAIHYGRLRSLLLALADQLDWPADSLFQLEPQEVVALPGDPAGRQALLALSEQRREQRQLARRLAQQQPPASVIFASRPLAVAMATPAAATGGDAGDDTGGNFSGNSSGNSGHAHRANELPAEPIAPGHAEGLVRIIRFDDQAAAEDRPPLAAGSGHEILVAPSANLGLAPLFRSAAGVIVEVGGVLAHCACQAREAGIPALVLADATRRLRNGDRVRLDAAQGRVILLARADQPAAELNWK